MTRNWMGWASIAAATLVVACSDEALLGESGGAGAGADVGGGQAGGAGAGGSGTGGDGGGVAGSGGGAPNTPEVIFPRTGITPAELGVLVNDDDPLSVSVAAYYVQKRGIPAQNVIHLSIPDTTANVLSEGDFAALSAQVDTALDGTDVQALAITWTKPYRVGKMSVTSAFALGFKAIDNTCTDPNSQGATPNPYSSNMASTRPFDELGFRPVMTLPATNQTDAEALIDRGVASDDTWPMGSAYLMNTSDQTRSARCIVNTTYGWTNECQALLDTWDSAASGIGAAIYKQNSITMATDILFYVQGLAQVPDIDTNTYLPGAVADHLTSFGGQIPDSGQMSAFAFLQAGATGSYGTVVEPCAYTQKFPNPVVLMPQYFGGATLIEAYWKSVVWPAEGIFIGEPLARPFGTGYHASFADGTLTIETTAMIPGHTYLVEAADESGGPFSPVLEDLTVPLYQRATFTVPNADRAVYRFRDAQ